MPGTLFEGNEIRRYTGIETNLISHCVKTLMIQFEVIYKIRQVIKIGWIQFKKIYKKGGI